MRVRLEFVRLPEGRATVRWGVVKKTKPDGVLIKCVDGLPYPAVWDFRKLKAGQEVVVGCNGRWWMGRWSGAAGSNLSVSGLKEHWRDI